MSWFLTNFPAFDEVVKLLIEKGYANQINSIDDWGNTPFHDAINRGNCWLNQNHRAEIFEWNGFKF